MLLHEPHGGTGELVPGGGLGRLRHDVAHREVEEGVGLFHDAGEVAGGDHADQTPRLIHYRNGAPLLGEQHDALAHGAVGPEGGDLSREHHVRDAQQEVPAQRAPRVQRREVLTPEALHFEQGHGEGVAQRQRGGGAGGGRERLGARLFGDARVEHHVHLAGEHGVGVARQGDQAHAQALELAHEAEQLVRRPAPGQENGHIVPPDDPQVAVQRVDGVEERRGRAGRGEGRGDLACDEAGLADPRDDHPPGRVRQETHGRGERRPQSLGHAPDGVRFEGEHAAPALNEIAGLRAGHRRAPESTS